MDAAGAFEESTAHECELFDLNNDPREMNNVYYELPNQKDIKILKTRLLQLKNQYEDTNGKRPEMRQAIQNHWNK